MTESRRKGFDTERSRCPWECTRWSRHRSVWHSPPQHASAHVSPVGTLAIASRQTTAGWSPLSTPHTDHITSLRNNFSVVTVTA